MPRPRTFLSLSATPRLWIAILAAVYLAAICARASAGDQSPEFKRCVSSCFADVCGPDGVDDGVTGRPEGHSKLLDASLQWTHWTCREDCQYHCTHQLSNEAEARVQTIREEVHRQFTSENTSDSLVTRASPLRENEVVASRLAALTPAQKQMVKYYGSWVFVRMYGVEEPLSVLFSAGNILAQLYSFRFMRLQIPDAFPLKRTYLFHTLFVVNACIWSILYHTRRRAWANRLDQLSTCASALHLTYGTLSRFLRQSSRPSSDASSTLPPSPVSLLPHVRDRPQRFCRVLQLACAAAFGVQFVVSLLSARASGEPISSLAALVQLAVFLSYALRPSIFPGGWRPGMVHHSPPSHVVVDAARPSSKGKFLKAFTIEAEQDGPRPPHGPNMLQHRSSASVSVASGSARSWNPHKRQISLQPQSRPALAPLTLPARTVSQVWARTKAPVSVKPLAYRRKKLMYLALAWAAIIAIKLCDFPPLLRTLDSQALWRAASIPFALAWYEWLIQDACALSSHSTEQSIPRSNEEDRPWVTTDARTTFAPYRPSHAPWWSSHASLVPRWVQRAGSLSYSMLQRTSQTGQRCSNTLHHLRKRGWAFNFKQVTGAFVEMEETIAAYARPLVTSA